MTNKKQEPKKFALATFMSNVNQISNPWGPADIDKLDIWDYKEFRKVVNACRFFYKRDPIASAVVNKMVDISITDLWFSRKGIEDNQFKLFLAIKDKLRDFAEVMALEYMLSGLVIPEISYAVANKEILKDFGIKKYEALVLPVSMWLRDPFTIKIKSSWSTSKPSYFAIIPPEAINFIMSGGVFPDGTRDLKLYEELSRDYPEFVAAIKRGETEFLLDNPLIIRRRFTTESPYPVPYMFSALEPLKHKRNIRRMDYSVAARAIKAIQIFRMGNDTFPVTEDSQEVFDSIKSQMTWRDSGGLNVESVFQLFANHTLDVEWVFPPFDALLNDVKYREVNGDIIMGLGFPGILLTGESEKSNTSSPDFATLSPIKTMNNMRDKIARVLNDIVTEISEQNHWKKAPHVDFKPVHLQAFKDLIVGLQFLYGTRNVSRQTLTEAFGYDWEEEHEKIKKEDKEVKAAGTMEVSPMPFSPQPNTPGEKPKGSEEKKKE